MHAFVTGVTVRVFSRDAEQTNTSRRFCSGSSCQVGGAGPSSCGASDEETVLFHPTLHRSRSAITASTSHATRATLYSIPLQT